MRLRESIQWKIPAGRPLKDFRDNPDAFSEPGSDFFSGAVRKFVLSSLYRRLNPAPPLAGSASIECSPTDGHALTRGPLSVYLIHIPADRAGVDHWLYFHEDPRERGCSHQVVEGVEFTDLDVSFSEMNANISARFPVLARSEDPPMRFKVFPSHLSVPLDFEPLQGFAFEFPTWDAFLETPVAKDSDWQPIK
jgi:hypothetical protein